MEDWEFLLQKEGDRSWLSMETPTLEIEEGKYRIAAHSSRANLDVEIRVTYQVPGEGKSLCRSQKGFCRTNSEGLVVIIPFTDFKPGLWELNCCGDIMSELLGEFWQESLQLQVLPKTGIGEQGSRGAGEQGRQGETFNSSIPNPILVNSLLEHSLQEVEPMLQELDAPSPPSCDAPIKPAIAEPGMPRNAANRELRLTLERDTFVRSQGESILISGRVDAFDLAQTSSLPSAFQGKIRYQLRDPQTSEILLDLEQHLPEQSLPLVFSYSLEIPREGKTPLLSGEVILEASCELPDGNENPVILASQAFTIAADFNHLPETQFSDSQSTAPLHLDLFEPEKMAKAFKELQPLSSQILPPKIVRSASTEKAAKIPQLPKLSNPKPKVKASLIEISDDRAFEALKLKERFWSRLNSLAVDSESSIWLKSQSLSFENSTEDAQTPAPEAQLTPEKDLVERQETIESLLPEIELEDGEKIEKLVSEGELTPARELDDSEKTTELPVISEENLDRDLPENTQLKTESPQPEQDLIEESLPLEEELPEQQPFPDTTANSNTLEIAVEDEEVWRSPISEPDSSELPASQQAIPHRGESPVPAPILTIAESELTAGEAVVVRLKLPQLPPALGSVYVKLSVQDCQTRCLLDGPRALVDWEPNDAGELEANTSLTVPLGSREIRFEAIAIDTETQRESHKVTLDKKIRH